ncbi:hypothetical protein ARMSODRAFT_1089222 [Armillaria solidipes]|uniref:Uncharacterized protein n=1 Tax=Armillaria solidipes TaxID=1076256 RepID=A0A2H3BEH2_9AGAR|nr:hypothetical protein ARMSODRAFT_1089222 [Armillaria solidipes]
MDESQQSSEKVPPIPPSPPGSNSFGGQPVVRFERRTQNGTTPSIHNLPPEIICIIFEILRDTLSLFMRVPFLLSLVCARWRSIALGCPSLWTRVSIRNLCHKDRIAACIERSGRSLLTIDICVPGGELFENECFQVSIRLCVQHAYQLPELVQLTVRRGILDDTSPIDEASRPHNNHYSISSLPWRAIKEMTFFASSGHLIMTALQHLTSLDKCIIERPTSVSPLRESVTSPLRVLELGFVDEANDFSMILEDVSLPNLEILRVENSCPDLPEVLIPIVSNLTALTALTPVNNWTFSDTDILKMLENAPGLQSFALHETYGKKRSSRVSEALLHRFAQETFLTKLQTITFVVIATINEESLVRMIAERAGTLKEIEVGLVRQTLKEATLLSLANLAVFRIEGTFEKGDVNTILLTR